MKVYRVQHLLTGNGPYTNGDTIINAALDAGFSNKHPDPVDDGIWQKLMEAFDHPEYRYGFDSIAQLLEWFDDDAMRILLDNDYVVAIYYVPGTSVRLGYRHLAYNERYATLEELHDTLPVGA